MGWANWLAAGWLGVCAASGAWAAPPEIENRVPVYPEGEFYRERPGVLSHVPGEPRLKSPPIEVLSVYPRELQTSPWRVQVLESSPTVTARKVVILSSRDPERPCLILAPEETLVLQVAATEPAYWDSAIRHAGTAARLRWLRERVEALRPLLQMDLLLPPMDL